MADLLVVPLKKSSDVDIVKPLKNLIQSTYNASKEPEDFSDALNELGRMRANAIWKVFEKSSLDAIYSYYDQLVALETKIPPQEVQIPFKWKDAFDKGSLFGGRMSLTISSLAYERMCVLFNIAAIQSALAAQQALDTEESLKIAAKLLQQAAGIFAYLKANIMMAVHQETTPDLNPETLNALSQIMLAQAQEVIAYKCIKDEMKESMVAKVCAQCEELYTDALRSMQKDQLKPLWDRDWIALVAAKQATFKGMTQFYQSLVCRANKAVGEEIARLQVAVEALKVCEGRAGAPGETTVRAARHLAEAVRDNDFIYHERVPEPRALDAVPRAPVARPTPPPDRWTADRDLFAALVPAAQRAALGAARARAGALGGAGVARLREASAALSEALAARGLPAALEDAAAGAAGAAGAAPPEALRGQAAAVRRRGGLPALRRLIADLPDLLRRNQEILEEAERMLREEAEADAALRAQFAARWSRTPSAALTEAFRANAAKYRQIIDNAVRADGIVAQKFQQHEESIGILSGDDDQLAAALPAAVGPARDAATLHELRHCMRQVEQLKQSRSQLEEELKAAGEALPPDGAAAAAAAEGGAALDRAVDDALRPLQGRVQESVSQQETLLAQVAALAGGGTGGSGGSGGSGGAGQPQERAAALGRLSAAHDAYLDLCNNLQEGAKFYNDLTQLLVAFQNKVSDYCFARKTEKDELLKDLTQEASRASVVEPAIPRREAPTPPAPAPAPVTATAPAPAQPAPLPYPTQPQGMPVPFGAPAAAAAAAPYPYYVTALPAYNPYATLPHPRPYAPQPYPQPYQPPYQPHQPPPGYNPYAPR